MLSAEGSAVFVLSYSQQIWSSSTVHTSLITERETYRGTEPRVYKGQSLSVWLLCLCVYQCSNACHRCCFCARREPLRSDKWATVFGPCRGTLQHKEVVVAGRWGLGGGARGLRVRQRSVFRSPLWHQRWEAEVGRFNSCSVSPSVLPTSCSDRGRGGGGGGRNDVNICCSACQASGAGMEHLQPVLEYWWERGGGDRRESNRPLRMAACVSISSCCSSFCLSVSVSHSPVLHSPLYNPTSRENKLHSKYKMIGLVAQKFCQLFFPKWRAS